jgi:hypothetical protein
MRVIAIKAGYDGLAVRDPETLEDGAPVVFDMPEGSKGTWFVEVDESGRPLVDLPKKVKDKTIPGAGPKKGSQQLDRPDRNYPQGQSEG